MKLETIKKDKKKNVIIGSMIVLSVVGCITLTTTRAKYKSVQSLKLASGTVNYKASDLHIVAVKISEDGENYTEQTEIPTSGYTLNTSLSKCRTPTSTLTGENAPVDESIPIEYEEGRAYIGVNKKNTKCYLYFDKIDGQTSSSIIVAMETSLSFKSGTPTFSTKATGAETESNNGIYKVSDGMYGGYSYYWRGAATTNHVIFDSKCWRIVRINGDKSIRLIYNGTPTGNTCPGNGSNSSSVVKGSTDSEKHYSTSDGQYNNSSYVGWTYTLSTQRTTGGIASNAKAQIEKWYNNNISTAAKAKVDSNGKFCNDRNVGTPPLALFNWGTTYTTTWTTNTGNSNRFAYAGVKRLYQDYNPTLSCDTEDVYSLAVGAITADEVEFAGGKNENNTSYYLNAGVSYWTMSPSHWDGTRALVLIVDANGYLRNYDVGNAYGLRPVINLRSDVIFNIGSDGTQNNPYIVQ